MTNEERLVKLEKELNRTRSLNRWLLCIVVLVVATLVSSWGLLDPSRANAQSTGVTVPKDNSANNFILRDENGTLRAALILLEGDPTLSLLDKNGDHRVMLSLIDSQPVLTMSDENDEIRVILGLAGGEPTLRLKDENGKTIWSAP